ncbi:hypothetical protein H0X32_03700 [Patescibacteria group bacterium]|nr:hypothetical protein [Patescibacteria group bacterium]
MLYSRDLKLEDHITQLLVSSPYQIKKLHEKLVGDDRSLSLRAVYKVVGNLIDAGVLLKVGKVVRVNEEWVREMRSKLVSNMVPQLSPGERMSYSFTSMNHLDTFWKTIVLQLEEYERDGQIFFYNPHNFWVYLPDRKESESAYYGHFAKSRLHAFFTVGGESSADKEFKRQYQNEYLQIDARDVPYFPRSNHLTILGDHVITVRIGKILSGLIDKAYKAEMSGSQLQFELERQYVLPFTSRFVLEHNPQKARRLKTMLSRNFYFPRQITP